ncbi:MAG TPA: sulfur carrier protein ThiS [Polyangiaceae bacterium]
MRVTVNGQEREIPGAITVRELIVRLGLDDGPVAVERNREVVPRALHGTTQLSDGDVLEIVHFVGGG